MTNIYELPEQHHRYDEASAWLAKIDKYELPSAVMPDAEKRALQAWMAADTDNQKVLYEMAQLWDKMDALSRLSDLFSETESKKVSWAAAAIAMPRSVMGIAASLMLAAFIGLYSGMGLQQGSELVSDNVYQTAVGEHSTVMLADGSQLILNTQTLVSVHYTAEHRLITLTRGEVHVSVAKDTLRPLSVIAGGRIVQAVGTEFNIEITNDQAIELIVTEGKVKVGVHQSRYKVGANDAHAELSDANKLRVEAAAASIAASSSTASAVMVSAGEALEMGASDSLTLLEERVTAVPQAEVAVKLSWQQGNLVFRGESLEDAVKEVGRYTSVEFVFLDEELKKVRIAGLFKAGDVEGLLSALRENFNIVSQRIDGKKVLLSGQ